MLAQSFNKAISTLREGLIDEHELQKDIEKIVQLILSKKGSFHSLKLLKFIFVTTKTKNEKIGFFSSNLKTRLEDQFFKDPSDFIGQFLYCLSIEKKSERDHMLGKLVASGWQYKELAEELLTEL